MGFKVLKLDERLITPLSSIQIIKPTAIQKMSIPRIIDGNDIIGIAPTGTGKTFAFLLPAIHWLLNAKIAHDDPSILIIVPTRELVKQTQENISLVTKGTEVSSSSIVAGQRENKQIRKFNKLVEIVVATPGRLNQFINQNILNLNNIGILIIDEIDRMLDLGFQIELRKIVKALPHKNKRQTLLFCSTLPKSVEEIAKFLQNKGQIVEVGRSISPKTITHELYEVTSEERFDVLLGILKDRKIESVLIFTRSIDNTRITTRNLLKAGLDCEEFHGGLTQRQRNKALENFVTGEVKVIVATDIAARGIDIKNITHVINFDVPKTYDDYLHRAGRTGRANTKGISIILATPSDDKYIDGIKKSIKSKIHIKKRRSQVEPKKGKRIGSYVKKEHSRSRPRGTNYDGRKTKFIKTKPFKKRLRRR